MNIRVNKKDPYEYKEKYYKLIEQYKLTGKMRKAKFFYEMIKKGFMKDFKKKDALIIGNKINSLIPILKNNFGQNWDIHLEPVFSIRQEGTRENSYTELHKFEGFIPHVVLYYPKITISNTKELSHEIKDLFVTFKINFKNHLYFEFFSGCRGSQKYMEYHNGYHHSHLRINKLSSFSDTFNCSTFCTGSNEINDLLAQIKGEESLEIIELFFLTIHSMIIWESLEGRPYIKIENLNLNSRDVIYNLPTSQFFEYYNSIRQYITDLSSINFVLSSNKYVIKQDLKFKSLIKDIVVRNLKYDYRYLLSIKKEGVEYSYNQPRIESKEFLDSVFFYRNEKPYTLVQGKKIIFNVESFTGDITPIEAYNVNSKILNYAARELEKELLHKSVRKSAIRKHFESSNV